MALSGIIYQALLYVAVFIAIVLSVSYIAHRIKKNRNPYSNNSKFNRERNDSTNRSYRSVKHSANVTDESNRYNYNQGTRYEQRSTNLYNRVNSLQSSYNTFSHSQNIHERTEPNSEQAFYRIADNSRVYFK